MEVAGIPRGGHGGARIDNPLPDRHGRQRMKHIPSLPGSGSAGGNSPLGSRSDIRVPARTRESVRFILALALLMTCFAPTAFGQSAGPVSVSLTSHKVEWSEAGKEVLASAERAKPGDIILFAATYRNRGNEAVSSLVPTLPVPRGMEYVTGSAQPAPAFASLDGVRFEPLPIKRPVTMPDGSVRLVKVPQSEYRAVRWSIDQLPAAGSMHVSSRVRIAPAGAQR